MTTLDLRDKRMETCAKFQKCLVIAGCRLRS